MSVDSSHGVLLAGQKASHLLFRAVSDLSDSATSAFKPGIFRRSEIWPVKGSMISELLDQSYKRKSDPRKGNAYTGYLPVFGYMPHSTQLKQSSVGSLLDNPYSVVVCRLKRTAREQQEASAWNRFII